MKRDLVVITGGAGRVATLLWPQLSRIHRVRLVDRVRPTIGLRSSSVEVRVGDLTDAAFAKHAFRGAESIVHLAGDPSPRLSWPEAAAATLGVMLPVLDAAYACGVEKFVFGSSVHAAGSYLSSTHGVIRPEWPARPCCPYGWSKAAGELAARTRVDAGHVSAVCLRLGWVGVAPHNQRNAANWLSAGDLSRLVAAALASRMDFGVYFGVSVNARGRWDIGSTRHDLGYAPIDDVRNELDKIAGPVGSGLLGCQEAS